MYTSDLRFLLDDEDGDSRLHIAAIEGDVEKLRQYHKNEHDMYSHNVNRGIKPLGMTPLELAVKETHLSALKFLISHDADVNIPDRKGQTPLYQAVQQGSLECVQLLLEAGSSPDGSSLNRTSPLFASMFLSRFFPNQYEIFKTLLRYGGKFEQDSNALFCTLCEIFNSSDREFFLTMYYESGGSHRRCVCKINKKYTEEDEKIMRTPLSLKSVCRITIRKHMPINPKFFKDMLPKHMINYLNYI